MVLAVSCAFCLGPPTVPALSVCCLNLSAQPSHAWHTQQRCRLFGRAHYATRTRPCCKRARSVPLKPTPPPLLVHGLSHRPQVFLPPELPLSQEGQALAGLQLLSTSQLIQPRAIEQSGEFGPPPVGGTLLRWHGRLVAAWPPCTAHAAEPAAEQCGLYLQGQSMCRSRG